MHDLVRLVLVTFGNLACTEKGEEWIVQFEHYEVRDGESTDPLGEAASECALAILYTMACKMDDVRRLHGRTCFGDGHWTGQLANRCNVCRFGDHSKA
jgi:hypothetical protein